jgi:hypothetical protein
MVLADFGIAGNGTYWPKDDEARADGLNAIWPRI